jgi:hypothetical protein
MGKGSNVQKANQARERNQKKMGKSDEGMFVVFYDVAYTCIAPCFVSETSKPCTDPVTHSPLMFLFLSLFMFAHLFFDPDIDSILNNPVVLDDG